MIGKKKRVVPGVIFLLAAVLWFIAGNITIGCMHFAVGCVLITTG